KQVTVLSYTTPTPSAPNGTPESNPQAADPAPLSKDKTIAGLFDRIEKSLASGPFRCDSQQGSVLYDYTVKFDPVLGYPTLIKVEPRGSVPPECRRCDIE